jgi:GDP-4-dehydro-6-deoxy-D-mannose reductase
MTDPARPAPGADLVTGALGFVGRWLIADLLASGRPVTGVGRHRAGEPVPAAVGPFRRTGDEVAGWHLFTGDPGRFHYRALALEEPGPVAGLVADLAPAAVYHLAAQSSAAVSFRDPVDTMRSNLMGTLHLLEAVRALPPADRPRVVAAGSCEEYGPVADTSRPVTEDAPCRPVSPYGVSKAAQTLLCMQYARSWDLPVVGTRSFSHTGPGQDLRFAFPSFARQIAAAEAGRGPAAIATGDLAPVRDFLDVRDVVRAYVLLREHGRPGETYNVCSGNPLTMGEGLEILVGGATRPVAVTRDPARVRPADIPWMVGDSGKLRRDTGWTPRRTIEDTLLELLAEARKEFA